MNMKRIARFLLIISFSSLMSGCFLYEEKAYNNPFDPDNTDGLTPIPYATIQLDGDTSDWDSITPFITDQVNEIANSGQPMIPGGDIDQLKMAQDDENLYFYLSTANGTPLETTEVGFSLIFSDENENFTLNPVGLAHESDGGVNEWSNYSHPIDDMNWDTYVLPNQTIRFTGVNRSDNAIEFGVSKTEYWDVINANSRVKIFLNTWYNPYNIDNGDGILDSLEDTEREYIVVLKSVDALDPSSDVPIVQFGIPSAPLIIDGNSGDMEIWNETGYWYQDFQDDYLGEQFNCDIDKVYIKQDVENIYVLLTFNNPAAFDSSGVPVSYNLNLTMDNGYINHTLHADHDGSVTWNVNVDANPSGCLAASAEPGYLELQFDKSEGWDSLPAGACFFKLESYDQSSTMVDIVRFMGSYKASTDTRPAP